MLFNKHKNPIAQRWEKRYSELDPAIQKKLDILCNKGSMTDELIPIKRARREIRSGDLFVVQPVKGLYFYGKVIQANIEHLNKKHLINGSNTIFIFSHKTNKVILPEEPLDYGNLLIAPKIVDQRCWTSGYFYTIGHIELTNIEHKLDYGFYDIAFGKYLKENGQELQHQPSILGTYARGSYGSVAYDMMKEFIINPSLLEIDF